MSKLIRLALLIPYLCACLLAQSALDHLDQGENIMKFAPVSPAARATFWNIDPNLGVGMKKYDGGIYVLSDNGWQSAFLVTDDGVIVMDAPSSYAQAIPKAIASVTDKPVKILIYSHCHKDRRRRPLHLRARGQIHDGHRLRHAGLRALLGF
jgi:hypothetical protein